MNGNPVVYTHVVWSSDSSELFDWVIGPNFAAAQLAGAKFDGAVLRDAKFDGANLTRVSLINTDLDHYIETVTAKAPLSGRGAYLLKHYEIQKMFGYNADFTGANLTGAKLRGWNFTNSNFTDANLTNTELGGTDFSNANMRGATLTGANTVTWGIAGPSGFKIEDGPDAGREEANSAVFDGADLTGAVMRKLNTRDQTRTGWIPRALADNYFYNTNLTGADLSGSNMGHVHMVDANLTGAKLDGVTIAGTDLVEYIGPDTSQAWTLLKNVNFSGASLVGAVMGTEPINDAVLAINLNFDGANLSDSQLVASYSRMTFDNATLTGADLRLDSGYDNRDYISGVLKYDVDNPEVDNPEQRGLSMRAANLTNARLSGYFREANLTDANLTNADVTNADLSYADLTDANTDGTIGLPDAE